MAGCSALTLQAGIDACVDAGGVLPGQQAADGRVLQPVDRARVYTLCIWSAYVCRHVCVGLKVTFFRKLYSAITHILLKHTVQCG